MCASPLLTCCAVSSYAIPKTYPKCPDPTSPQRSPVAHPEPLQASTRATKKKFGKQEAAQEKEMRFQQQTHAQNIKTLQEEANPRLAKFPRIGRQRSRKQKRIKKKNKNMKNKGRELVV
jgi:hypothetical protein